jgi:hypothetical protein
MVKAAQAPRSNTCVSLRRAAGAEEIMAFVRLVLPVLACVLLAAHFFRAGLLPLAVLSGLLPLVLAVPRRWAARAMQAALLLGAVEWLRTLAALSAERIAMGQPVLRLVAILLAVALFTAASALVFRNRTLRLRYRLER